MMVWGPGGGVVEVSACMSGTRGSGVVYSTGNVLGFGLYQSCGDRGSVGHVCVLVAVVWVV